MRLYELAQEYRALQELLEQEPVTDDGEVLPFEDVRAALDSISAPLDQKAEAIARMVGELKAEAAQLKVEADRLSARKATRDKRVEHLRRYVRDCMVAANKRSIKGLTHTLSVRDGGQRVEIEDVEALPDDFVEIVRKPKTAEIGRALKAGTDIPGAGLEDCDPVLTIR